MSNTLKHYGVARKSGRYPWGSGEDPEQRHKSFLGQVEDLKKKGLSEVDIAKGLNLKVNELRAKQSIAKDEIRKAKVAQAITLKDKGMSNVAIGERMGINESSVRSLLNETIMERNKATQATANILKDNVEKKTYIDVGAGVERHMGVSRTKLNTALIQLQDEGYKIHYLQVDQLGTGKKTSLKVLTKDDVEWKDVNKNKGLIRMTTDYSEDGGRSFLGLEPIRSISKSRIMVRYAEDGGKDKDGVIELRRGVDELSLGDKKYAQVRIGVDDTHYMKGMAIYTDTIPKGVDIIYNTNKTKDQSEKVFKKMEDDPDNPFGSTVRQKHYIDKSGKTQLSALNIMGSKEGSGEEGAWGEWSKSISSQVLSKQTPVLAKRQLGLAYDVKKQEYDEIMALTNPVVKKKLLESFADDCDSAAVHLKAAALPRQSSHILLPIPSLKPTEIYAPNFRDGERVVVVRHPHGGIFEIPELVVNNKNKEARSILGRAKDAVGIHPKVAEQLSGADFDGDTGIVIPNNKGEIKTSSPLKGLVDFDPKEKYKAYEGMKPMSSRTKGIEMGMISNLITDMTIGGANNDEIARAVRHSMVVIDAEKHKLNYKQSAIDNGISELKARYQPTGGASTLISRSSSAVRVNTRKELTNTKNMTPSELKDYTSGKKVYQYTNETYTDKKGKTQYRTTQSTRMYETEDAHELSSGTRMESIYADHANSLKSLGNSSRKEALLTPRISVSAEAKIEYANEVNSLKASLNLALKNKPLERQALLIANSVLASKKAANPDMTPDEIKKIKNQALIASRVTTGASKQDIKISEREWAAIQSGAVSHNILTQILDNTDLDRVKQLATPRSSRELNTSQITKARTMLAKGRTQAEIAEALGVSASMIAKIM